jgi:transglutaminase-like putative cysteine protease
VPDQDRYRRHSPLTDPGPHRALLAGLPADVPALAAIVRGVLVHRDETGWLYGFELPAERRDEANTRYTAAILDRLGGDLRERPPRERFAGTCRDFCLLLCAFLREAGVPARLRHGFAGYFVPDFFDDHVVVEHWSDAHGWRLADAQLGGSAREAYGVDLDVTDVPRDAFVVGGAAWLAGRRGGLDPGRYGVQSAGLTGMWEIQGNVVRDLSSLALREPLPWDNWGLIETRYEELGTDDLALLDAAAEVSAAGGPYERVVAVLRDERLRNP